MQHIPASFQTKTFDQVLTGFDVIVSPQIQLELAFDRPLDAERLARAVDLTLDAEPVLGCRFQPHWRSPRWVRLPVDARNAFAVTEDPAVYQAFLTEVFAGERGPQIRVMLLRRNEGDILLLKVNHVVADAGGVKEIAEVLAKTYRALGRDATFRPTPNLNGSRSLWQVFKRIPRRHYPRLFFEHLRLARTNLIPRESLLVTMTGKAISITTPRYTMRVLDAAQVARLKEYGRQHGAMLNDIILAAFARALAKLENWDRQSCLRVGFTVDFRRYLPDERAAGICNLSGIDGINLGRDPGVAFDDTLRRVVDQTRRIKSFWPGVRLAFGSIWSAVLLPAAWHVRMLRAMFRLGLKTKNLSPAITNMGPIRPERVTFDAAPTCAWLIPPPGKPPAYIAGMSGYAGTINLAVGYYPESLPPETAERLFDLLLAELPEQS